MYRCEHEAGHRGDHRARSPRTGELTWWVRSYPTPPPERLRAAEASAAALTPELEVEVLADEERRHAEWVAANPDAVRRAHEMAARHHPL